MLTNWRHKNGHVVEVQFNDRDLEAAKPQGHALLDQVRVIDEKARQEGRKLTPAETTKRDGLNTAMSDLYHGAWAKQQTKHGGTIEKAFNA